MKLPNRGLQRAILALTGGCLALLVGLAVVLGTARLLAAMGDAGGAAVLDRIGLAAAVLLAIDVLGLLLALGVQAAGNSDHPGDE
jgi:hypothetical protein